jgi:hypothetical protein
MQFMDLGLLEVAVSAATQQNGHETLRRGA